jgi:putative FmdB family regulatory protein
VPVYEYVCTECGEPLEVRQSFTDAALTVCPNCSGRLRKVLSPVGVVFKGSGFYRNDSREAAASALKGGTAEGKPKSDKDGAGDGSGDKGSKKDAATTPKESASPAKSGSGSGSNGSSGSSSAGASSTTKASTG